MLSDNTVSPTHYNELMSTYKNYCDAFDSLYKLKTKDEKELSKIYQNIKIHLIDSYKYPPNQIITDMSNMSMYNNRYMKSYLYIVKQIFEEYHPKDINAINSVFDYLFYKEYGIVLVESNRTKFKEFESKNYTLDIHKENTIYRAIMDNDKELLISIIEKSEFDKDQRLDDTFYPYSLKGYSYLELCCYYGSVDCFKFIITKFHPEITKKCLRFSFLGGNQEILSECLKKQEPDKKCMKIAIITHNIDFVSFLRNEYNIEIDLADCGLYNNLQSFLVYLDQTNNIDTCLIYSSYFFLPSLIKYFISHGADINARDEEEETPLHKAAYSNSKETAEVLISHGADINARDKYKRTPLHKAAFSNSKETAEVLISHGADINARDEDEKTPLHNAAFSISKETAEVLISHGADINARDEHEKTPLHYAAYSNSKETAEVLISHGADINARDKYKETPLHKAAFSNSKETAEVLISYGADINARDEDEETPLHYAAYSNSKETAEVLISHGADVSDNDSDDDNDRDDDNDSYDDSY
ncbi:hypothetical protein TVAG_272220 [Trichomonas vaginalis G3]|uniref:DUF3447 domain-containing protein n=1 Tax=Trichomonas vaginalis (strain ATCC PRA-98 / G3) TaxID=412133 RepID=A2FXS9_TRIV3|nr:ankyrin repeat and SOCS box-containing protein 4 family [Trichomonas vaginalis G3]EAX90290.1 hypothetical protein TVAG_272220 [Trichomonas vaginalis G3]KAI5543545.1 ankyrin repeat and SOCS box-containing protein 4 family [Trichomonas vaginalis G3]|eukprot:XP_001303220.1 hypothetical protein [Trichomonas vaginalis G3]